MKSHPRMTAMKLTICALFFTYFGFMISQHASQKWPSIDSNRSVVDSVENVRMALSEDFKATENVSGNFESTLRGCLGPNCFDEDVFQPDGSKSARVGMLAPFNSGGEDILRVLLHLMEKPNAASKSQIHLIHETHVPAYGYGKNHGWSRIIRLVRKIVPHTLSLSAALRLKDQSTLSAALDVQARQLVRWHCRLNHVAAHTKLLTVFVEDILERPALELEMMLTFIGFKFSRPELLAAVPDFIVALRNSLTFSTADLPSQLSKGTSTDSDSVGIGHPSSVLSLVAREHLQVVTSAISSELLLTDGLTRWPCESFRNIVPFSAADERRRGKERGKGKRSPNMDKISLSPTLLMSPSMLAANCSSSFVTCSVGFDRAGG